MYRIYLYIMLLTFIITDNLLNLQVLYRTDLSNYILIQIKMDLIWDPCNRKNNSKVA